MKENHYTIGKISMLSNLSIDQLHHYDKLGLLVPEGREDNNYRYYTDKQLETLLVIKEFKKLGLSLKMISSFVENQDLTTMRATMEEALLLQRIKLAQEQKRYDDLVDASIGLEKALSQQRICKDIGNHIEEGFEVQTIAERPIISVRSRSKSYKTNHYTERYIELQSLIEAEKARVGRNWFIAYHDPYQCIFDWGEEAEGDMEFFANVKEVNVANPHIRYFGGFLAACATYVGPYTDDRHKKTYESLTKWAVGLGYKTSGISYQELVVGRSITNKEDEFVTKIYLPLNVKEF